MDLPLLVLLGRFPVKRETNCLCADTCRLLGEIGFRLCPDHTGGAAEPAPPYLLVEVGDGLNEDANRSTGGVADGWLAMAREISFAAKHVRALQSTWQDSVCRGVAGGL